VIAAIGLWGGNCVRGGIVAASAGDASDGYLERMAVPYWRAIATGYETLALGTPGGEVFDSVTDTLAGEDFASSLNPGHLILLPQSCTPACLTPFRLAPDPALAFA
jgi:hypothetical protein